jgi:hypothetical protein
MSERLKVLENILDRRQVLWQACLFYAAASERSPTFGTENQAAWNADSSDLRDADRQLRELAQRLREEYREDFSAWIQSRREVWAERFAQRDLPAWERNHLSALIARWARFLEEDYEDFYRWTTW